MIGSRKVRDGAIELIFSWKDRYHRKLRLTFFLIIAIAIHVFCFYLFQVEYPKAERQLPYTAQITVLNPRDTLTQVALRQIDDRTVSIDSAARDAVRGTEIEDYATMFKPFFKNYEARLKAAPPIFETSPIADLVPPGAAVLPKVSALPLVKAPDSIAAYVRQPHMTIRGEGLENRDLLHIIDWSNNLPVFEKSDGFNAATFMIAVDANGMVRQCLSGDSDESGVFSMLHQKVRTLRFQPIRNRKLQWGWVDLKW